VTWTFLSAAWPTAPHLINQAHNPLPFGFSNCKRRGRLIETPPPLVCRCGARDFLVYRESSPSTQETHPVPEITVESFENSASLPSPDSPIGGDHSPLRPLHTLALSPQVDFEPWPAGSLSFLILSPLSTKPALNFFTVCEALPPQFFRSAVSWFPLHYVPLFLGPPSVMQVEHEPARKQGSEPFVLPPL